MQEGGSGLSKAHRSCDIGVESIEERDESLHVHSHMSSCCSCTRIKAVRLLGIRICPHIAPHGFSDA